MEHNETQTQSVKHGDWLPYQKSGHYLQAFRKKVRKTDTNRRTDGLTDGQSANLKTNYKTMPGQKQYLYIFLQNKRASKIWNGVACNGR